MVVVILGVLMVFTDENKRSSSFRCNFQDEDIESGKEAHAGDMSYQHASQCF